MAEQRAWRVSVDCHSGFKADERPVRFRFGTTTYRVEEVVDQWYEPESTFFKVLADDGNLYILRHDNAAGWTLVAFRRGPAGGRN